MAEQGRTYRQAANSRPLQQSYNSMIVIRPEELFFRMMDRWKLISCLAILFALLFGLFTHYLITPKYEATSHVYVLSRSDSAINMSDLNIGSALTKDYLQAFEMWEVHEEVITNLDLPYTEAALAEMLTVTNRSGTRILNITITSEDPKEAAAIANEYAVVIGKYLARVMNTDAITNVMSYARTAQSPVTPNKAKNIVLGFVLGAGLAMGYVFVQMLKDDKFKTPEDIRKFCGVVTLASVPLEKKRTTKKAVKRR